MGNGTASGIKSGTVNGEVIPTNGSRTVRAEGEYIVRQGDPCLMNNQNNPGIYVTSPAPSAGAPQHAAHNSNPPPAPKERSVLDKAAQYYKDNVSKPLHGFAGKSMEVGGNTAAAVGGGVSAVGGVAEGVATGLDHVAEFALSGNMPNLVHVAAGLAERMVLNRLTRFVPGMKQAAATAKAEAGVVRNEAKVAEKQRRTRLRKYPRQLSLSLLAMGWGSRVIVKMVVDASCVHSKRDAQVVHLTMSCLIIALNNREKMVPIITVQ